MLSVCLSFGATRERDEHSHAVIESVNINIVVETIDTNPVMFVGQVGACIGAVMGEATFARGQQGEHEAQKKNGGGRNGIRGEGAHVVRF